MILWGIYSGHFRYFHAFRNNILLKHATDLIFSLQVVNNDDNEKLLWGFFKFWKISKWRPLLSENPPIALISKYGNSGPDAQFFLGILQVSDFRNSLINALQTSHQPPTHLVSNWNYGQICDISLSCPNMEIRVQTTNIFINFVH